MTAPLTIFGKTTTPSLPFSIAPLWACEGEPRRERLRPAVLIRATSGVLSRSISCKNFSGGRNRVRTDHLKLIVRGPSVSLLAHFERLVMARDSLNHAPTLALGECEDRAL